MSKLFWIVAALASFSAVHAQTGAAAFRGRDRADAETESARLVVDCNAVADSATAKRRNFHACETLEKDERLSLVDPAAVTAFRQYQEERLQACLSRQASPRGQSRAQPSCTP